MICRLESEKAELFKTFTIEHEVEVERMASLHSDEMKVSFVHPSAPQRFRCGPAELEEEIGVHGFRLLQLPTSRKSVLCFVFIAICS